MTERLFFAAHPDAASAARIAALVRSLRAPLGLRARAIEGQRSHVTLLFVGSWPRVPDGLLPTLLQAGEAAAHAAGAVPFELRFDRVASFNRRPSNRPIVLLADPAGPVAGLHAMLAGELRSRAVPFDDAPAYAPHLTLMYDDAKVEPQPVEAIAWTVREFSLMHSQVGRSTHSVLGRWPLAR